MQLQHFALSEMTQNLSNNIKIKYQNGEWILGGKYVFTLAWKHKISFDK